MLKPPPELPPILRTSPKARRVMVIDYFSPSEVAGIMGITVGSVRRLIHQGALEFIKIGRVYRVPARALLPSSP